MKLLLIFLLFVLVRLSHSGDSNDKKRKFFNDKNDENESRKRTSYIGENSGTELVKDDKNSSDLKEIASSNSGNNSKKRMSSGDEVDEKDLKKGIFLVGESSETKFNQDYCYCRLLTENRIVGGKNAHPHSIPWMVSLANSTNNKHFCGGTIINRNHILTSSGCLEKFKDHPETIAVRVGLHELDDVNIENNYIVDEIVLYNSLNKPLDKGDIAILKLKKSIDFVTGRVEPACLNFIKKSYSRKPLMISGWGAERRTLVDMVHRNYLSGNFSKVLKKASFSEKRGINCSAHHICVQGNQTGPNTFDSVCDGDKGGPLHDLSRGEAYVEGVVSTWTDIRYVANDRGHFLQLCNGEEVYISRLSFYEKEIKEIIEENYCSSPYYYEDPYRPISRSEAIYFNMRSLSF